MNNSNLVAPAGVNLKPYRTKAQKELARKTAVKCEDGAWRTDAPVSYHTGSRR